MDFLIMMIKRKLMISGTFHANEYEQCDLYYYNEILLILLIFYDKKFYVIVSFKLNLTHLHCAYLLIYILYYLKLFIKIRLKASVMLLSLLSYYYALSIK